MRNSLPFLLLLLLLPSTRVHAQVGSRCPVAITVADTLFLPGATPQQDSVRYHLQVSPSPDSLFWSPSALFADSTAAEQWLTLGCGDTVTVRATACFHNVNLFHWQQPGFVRTHTGYNYIDTPADGDLCRPRSITMNQNPQQLCPELTTANYQNAMIIRTDTLRCYGDSIPAFFNYDTNYRNETTTTLSQRLRQIPNDSAYAPFYIDTIVMWNPLRNHTFVLYTNYYRFLDNGDTLAALPSFGFVWTIDDTASILFSPGNRRRMCDTTFFNPGGIELPRDGLPPSLSMTRSDHFTSTPRPHGVAVFRFYETPTPYYNTVPFICINRLEMLGDCWSADSLALAGPGCGCQVRDTLSRSVCSSQLPYLWHDIPFTQPGIDSLLITALACDTFRILRLSLMPDDTLAYSDTIVQNDLPWVFHGHIYQASGSDTLLLPGLLPACDTLMYYQLHVIDNVFDTTYTYICPDQLPYYFNGAPAHGDTVVNVLLQGSYGQDSTVTCFLFVNAASDTIIYDTIVEEQLPWPFLDSLFHDTVSNMPFVLTNEAGCDSIIHYNLYIFWNGDHCDSLLTFPNFVTPNGDGINDCFVIGGLVENQCYPYNTLVIVDRTGSVVYRATNISRKDQFWDPAAHRMPAGTYFYRFVGHGLEHSTQHQGCIELLK